MLKVHPYKDYHEFSVGLVLGQLNLVGAGPGQVRFLNFG